MCRQRVYIDESVAFDLSIRNLNEIDANKAPNRDVLSPMDCYFFSLGSSLSPSLSLSPIFLNGISFQIN